MLDKLKYTATRYAEMYYYAVTHVESLRCASIYLSIHLSIYPSIRPSIYLRRREVRGHRGVGSPFELVWNSGM